MYSVSHTTRPQGSRESHGRDYYFINEMTFNRASDAVSSKKSIPFYHSIVNVP